MASPGLPRGSSTARLSAPGDGSAGAPQLVALGTASGGGGHRDWARRFWSTSAAGLGDAFRESMSISPMDMGVGADTRLGLDLEPP
jgi:hypothetical protein